MKTLFAGSAIAIILSAAATAQAADAVAGPYVRLDTGWSFSRDAGKDLDDDVGDSPIIGAGVGYRFNQYLRADVTLAYRGGYEIDVNGRVLNNNVNWQGDVSALTGLVNVYGDIGKFGILTPYVGAGIGVSRNQIDDIAIHATGVTGHIDGETTNSFAWQLSAGVGIEVAPKWTVDVGYRYINLGEAKSGNTGNVNNVGITGEASKGDLSAHEIQAGVRYQF